MKADETPEQRDARYWRTLMTHFKRDHVWYNVIGAPEKFNSIEEVLDAVDAAGTTDILFDD